MDLETVSQYNPPTEPKGQERRVGRPDVTYVGSALGHIPAGVAGSTNISSGATINAGNHTLRVKSSVAASFSSVVVANAVYASGAALVAAVNTALAGLSVVARLDNAGTHLVLQSTVPGVGSYIEVDTVGNGSTFNTPVGFAAGGVSFTVPSVASVITATLPVSGPLDVSTATLTTNVGAGATSAQLTALADTIAPHFVDTDTAIKSFQVGMISGFLSASYNPDSRRFPALPNGAAITVVQDDGVSLFTAPLTVITGAVHNSPNGGDITITGTNLGNSEVDSTVVRVTSADGSRSVKLYQKVIRTTLSGGTQGSVSATSIVIPASLLSSLGVAGSKVIVQYTSLASNLFTVT
jgi:hypothetical protein